MTEAVEPKDLTGKHILAGVDFSNQSIKQEWGDFFKDCQVVNFILDGRVYSAIEDPEDGYRSSMRELRVIEDTSLVANTFPPFDVMGRHRTFGHYSHHDDVIEFYDIANGRLVLEVGTEDIDDYYPGFVANFYPEAMSINEGKDAGH